MSNVEKVYIDHGENDNVVPLWNADEMTARLQAQGVNVDYPIYSGAGPDLTLSFEYLNKQKTIFNEFIGAQTQE